MTDLTQEEKSRLVRRLKSLEEERKRGWESHWRELSANFLPRRARFLDSGDPTNEDNRRNDLEDGVGVMALRVLASGMQAGLTSQARPWFSLTLGDKDMAKRHDVKLWLQDTQEKMLAVFSGSNFYTESNVLYLELGCFGTGAMVVEDDPDEVARFRTLTVGEYCLDNDDRGRVDTIYRRVRMTPRQIVESWPDTVPENVKRQAERSSVEWMTVLHAVEPNLKRKNGSLRANERPYRSVFMMLEGDSHGTVLENSGYYEFPALCPRWITTGGDVYGSSPAMDALPDCRQLQKITESSRFALEKEVNPPLLASSAFGLRGVDASPGAMNYDPGITNGHPSIRPMYEVRANLAGAKDVRMELKEQVRAHLFNDLFMMLANLDDKRMTALEVAQRNSERMQNLGPVLDRLNPEYFRPLIARVYGLMDRRGMIATAPPSLNGQEVQVEFLSILALAQKQSGIGALSQTVGFVGQAAQFSSEVIDLVDFDAATRIWADMHGAPPALLRSPEDVGAIREARAQQAQQQRMMDMMREGAAMAKDGAAAASDLGVPEMMNAANGQAGGA